MKTVLIVILSISISFTYGCASIFCGDDKTINVTSDPVGAKFLITSQHNNKKVEGVTPTNVTLKRGSGYFRAGDYTIEFAKDGYETKAQSIPQGFETGWYFFGNIIVFGGVTGLLIVDPITGGMWDIKDVHVELAPTYELLQGKLNLPPADTSKKITGYRATIDSKTGKPITYPVYENEKK